MQLRLQNGHVINSIITAIKGWAWSEWGTIFSALGLLASFAAWQGVKRIRAIFLAKKRLPDLIGRIAQLGGKANAMLISATFFATQQNPFRELLHTLDPVLSAAAARTSDSDACKRIKALRKLIKKSRHANLTHDQAFGIYAELVGIEESLKHHLEDLRENV